VQRKSIHRGQSSVVTIDSGGYVVFWRSGDHGNDLHFYKHGTLLWSIWPGSCARCSARPATSRHATRDDRRYSPGATRDIYDYRSRASENRCRAEGTSAVGKPRWLPALRDNAPSADIWRMFLPVPSRYSRSSPASKTFCLIFG
jgi:hypothetical protein